MLEKMFSLYTHRYLRRHFHAVYRLGDLPCFAADGQTPLLVCLNHSSWWDVLLGLLVVEELFGWEWYSVMDARQLQRYKFFARLGMIGVDRTSLQGAKEFLAYAETLLKGQNRALWLTPQGEMLSNWQRPIHFQPGIGHIAERLGDFYFTTVAFHYEFWNERLPEAFVSLSPVERIQTGENFDRKAFVRAQEARLQAQMDRLLAESQSRDVARFCPLLTGSGGISTTYDAMRSLGARLHGKTFRAEHSDLVTPQWKQADKNDKP